MKKQMPTPMLTPTGTAPETMYRPPSGLEGHKYTLRSGYEIPHTVNSDSFVKKNMLVKW